MYEKNSTNNNNNNTHDSVVHTLVYIFIDNYFKIVVVKTARVYLKSIYNRTKRTDGICPRYSIFRSNCAGAPHMTVYIVRLSHLLLCFASQTWRMLLVWQKDSVVYRVIFVICSRFVQQNIGQMLCKLLKLPADYLLLVLVYF